MIVGTDKEIEIADAVKQCHADLGFHYSKIYLLLLLLAVCTSQVRPLIIRREVMRRGCTRDVPSSAIG
jgi:hypothetical protein